MREDVLARNHEIIFTAYHEAGHTIAALLHYIYPTYITVETSKNPLKPDQDLGYTEVLGRIDDVRDGNLLYILLIQDIYFNYGGLAAEKILYKDLCGTEKIPMVLKDGSRIDRNFVSNIIKKYNLAPSGNKRFNLKRKLFSNIQKELIIYWDDVKLVAQKLIQKGKLNSDELKDFLSKKSKNKDFWKQRYKDLAIISEFENESDYYSYFK